MCSMNTSQHMCKDLCRFNEKSYSQVPAKPCPLQGFLIDSHVFGPILLIYSSIVYLSPPRKYVKLGEDI